MSLRTLLTVALVLSTTYSSALARYASPDIGTFDPQCPQGTRPGFEYNAFQYNIPYNTTLSKMGSFLHAEWCTGPLDSTTGKDNTPGATRTNTFHGTVITEKLLEYSSSPGRFYQRIILSNGPISFEGVNLPSYTEEISATSICGGSASFIVFTGVYCADKPGQIYVFYQGFRRGIMAGVAKKLGAFIFEGTCPDSVHEATTDHTNLIDANLFDTQAALV